jgi:hypothetical protein
VGWSGKGAGGIAKAGESVGEGAAEGAAGAAAAASRGGGIATAAEGPSLARSIAQGAAGAGAVLGAGAALGAVTGGKIPRFSGPFFEGSFTSVGEKTDTPESRAIRAKYFPSGQTAAEKSEASNRLVNDALNREREWRNSAIEAQHPDWSEQQVAEEWVRYWLGDAAARRFTFRPG